VVNGGSIAAAQLASAALQHRTPLVQYSTGELIGELRFRITRIEATLKDYDKLDEELAVLRAMVQAAGKP
jgi:hypothetical protein